MRNLADGAADWRANYRGAGCHRPGRTADGREGSAYGFEGSAYGFKGAAYGFGGAAYGFKWLPDGIEGPGYGVWGKIIPSGGTVGKTGDRSADFRPMPVWIDEEDRRRSLSRKGLQKVARDQEANCDH